MTSKADLTAHFIAAAAETPYVVTATENGVRVELNLVDAKWITIMQAQHLERAFILDIALSEPNTARITQTLQTLSWEAGLSGGFIPHLSAMIEKTSGSMIQFSSQKTVGYVPGEGIKLAVNYTFDSRDATGWAKKIISDAGWKTGLPVQTLIGIMAAVLGCLVALGAGLASLLIPR